MLKNVSILLVCTSIVASSSYGQATAPIQESKVLTAKTPTWETERDLLVMIDQSADRIPLADAIVSVSLQSMTLTDAQRYDGLRVAGSSLYHDKEYLKSAVALEAAASYTSVPHEKAEVLAAAGEARFDALDDSSVALALYVQSADQYISSESSQIDHVLAGGTFRRLVDLAILQEDYSLVFQYSNQATALSDRLIDRSLDLAFFQYNTAYSANKIGDPLASQLYGEFLAAHPSYMNSQPLLGLIPSVRIQKALLDGSAWDKPDPNFIELIHDIVRNPDYELMPIRVAYADKLASSWDKLFAYQASISLRSEVGKSTLVTLNSLDSTDPADLALGRRIWYAFASCQLNAAHILYYRKSDVGGALEFLDRIILPNDFASNNLVSAAHDLEAVILDTP